MKVGIIGSGAVACSLAKGFLKYGHEVKLGSRSPDKLKEFVSENPDATVGNFADAAAYGDLIVLAVKGLVAREALDLCGAENLIDKTVIDSTNPIDDMPPVNGVLSYFTTMNSSLMEQLQTNFPQANFVKAFNSVGNAHMVDPQFGVKPTMFICGDDEQAKQQVVAILQEFGWEACDCGKVESARAIEPLCILWCLPGFLRNDWSHAFKMLK